MYTVHFFDRTGTAYQYSQDRSRFECHEGRQILVIADGHGGKPYCRSAVGAWQACQAALDVLKSDEDISTAPGAIKKRYDERVARHLKSLELKPDELERLQGRPAEQAYGTTLLAVRLEDCAEVFQLGDGEIYLFDAQGQLLPPLPDDKNCHGRFTSSMCYARESAIQNFRSARYDHPAAVLMFTDGCEGGFQRAARALTDLEHLEEEMNQMLRATARGDDQTCLLAVDSAIVEGEAFQTGLMRTMKELREAARARHLKEMELDECERLHAYLRGAIEKARVMDPDQMRAYLMSLRPVADRYVELHERYYKSDSERR